MELSNIKTKPIDKDEEEEKTARIMANGDLLYHIPIYRSALKEDGTYDFMKILINVKPWLKQADLIIGDFEGMLTRTTIWQVILFLMHLEKLWMPSRMLVNQVLDLAH